MSLPIPDKIEDKVVTESVLQSVLVKMGEKIQEALAAQDANLTKKLNDFSLEIQTRISNIQLQPTVSDDQKGQIISKIADKAIDKYLGGEKSEGFLSDDWIKQELAAMVKENLEIGHEINRAIKKTLTGGKARTAMTQVIESHEPA